MPLYEFACAKDHREEHFITSVDDRDKSVLHCKRCHGEMKRLPGGKGLLFFEEGRERWIHNLRSDKPIRSHKEHQEAMKARGVEPAGATMPHKTTGRISEKGKWI